MEEPQIDARMVVVVLLRSLRHLIGGLEKLLRTGEV